MAKISGRFYKKRKWILLKLIISVFIGIGIGNFSLAQAQSFQRICKNGVIYYYFPDRGEGGRGQPYFRSAENRIIRAPMGRKMAPLELESAVEAASRHYNLPPSLIKAVIRVESNFVGTATSSKGARGLMQLMPRTAEELQVRNPYDIQENVWAGTRYLSLLLDKFGYRLPLALAAYNAGPQRVEKCQDIPPIKETQGFVRDVCVSFLQYSASNSLKKEPK